MKYLPICLFVLLLFPAVAAAQMPVAFSISDVNAYDVSIDAPETADPSRRSVRRPDHPRLLIGLTAGLLLAMASQADPQQSTRIRRSRRSPKHSLPSSKDGGRC